MFIVLPSCHRRDSHVSDGGEGVSETLEFGYSELKSFTQPTPSLFSYGNKSMNPYQGPGKYFPLPSFFWVLVCETWIVQVAPELLPTALREGDIPLGSKSLGALPTAWLLEHTTLVWQAPNCASVCAVAPERAFNNAEFKVIRNSIAVTRTQILNYCISLRWAEL